MITYAPEVQQSLITLQDRFVWETVSHEKYERSPQWYAIMGVVSLFLLAYAIWNTNFLFAFLILLTDILLILGYKQDPHAILIQIGDHGVVIDGSLHLYQDLSDFAIIYNPPYVKTLYLTRKDGFNPTVRVLLEEQNPVEIRGHLMQFLAENPTLSNERLSDTLARLLRI